MYRKYRMKVIPFERSFASSTKAIHWSDKNTLKPHEVAISSGKNFWFDCNVCNHSFDARPNEVTNRGRWCTFCSHRKLCRDENCKSCYNISFASSDKAKYWSDKNKLKPREVTKSSNKKFLFDCECGHSFDIALCHLTNHGQFCPYCSKQKLCGDEKCDFCFRNSFASSDKAIFWSDRNKLKPHEVTISSKKKCWFDCDVCNHSFESSLRHVTNSGSWCIYCATSGGKLCNDIDCGHCVKQSFASSDKAIFWSDRNKLKPRDVTKSCDKKFFFDCDECGNYFESRLASVTNGSWCPICVNKTERKLHEFLKTIYPTIITQFKQTWCRHKRYLPFDFCIPELKIIIELDGRQHFVRTHHNWKSPEDTLKTDKYNETCANRNFYSTIRILQDDVWNDRYDWKTEIVDMINEVAKCQTIENRYMCKRNEYVNHMMEEPTITTIATC